MLRGHLKISHIADKRKNFHMGGRGFEPDSLCDRRLKKKKKKKKTVELRSLQGQISKKSVASRYPPISKAVGAHMRTWSINRRCQVRFSRSRAWFSDLCRARGQHRLLNHILLKEMYTSKHFRQINLPSFLSPKMSCKKFFIPYLHAHNLQVHFKHTYLSHYFLCSSSKFCKSV